MKRFIGEITVEHQELFGPVVSTVLQILLLWGGGFYG